MHIYSKEGIPNEPIQSIPNQQSTETQGIANGRSITTLNTNRDNVSQIASTISHITQPTFPKAASLDQDLVDMNFNATMLNPEIENTASPDQDFSYDITPALAVIVEDIVNNGADVEDIIIDKEDGNAIPLSDINISEFDKLQGSKQLVKFEDKEGNLCVIFRNKEEAIDFKRRNFNILHKGQRKHYKAIIAPPELSSKLDASLEKSIQNYIAHRMDQAKKESKEEDSGPIQTLPTYISSRYTPITDHSASGGIEIPLPFFSSKRYLPEVQTAIAILQARKEEEQRQADDDKKVNIKRTEIERQEKREENKNKDIQLKERHQSQVKSEINAREKARSIPPRPQPRQLD